MEVRNAQIVLTIRMAIYLMLAAAALTTPPRVAAQPAAATGTAGLIATIQSDAGAAEKAEAIAALTRAGAAEAIPALASLLADERLGPLACAALEAMPDPAAGAALRRSLSTLRGRDLAGVIAALGNRRDAEAAADLERLLDDPDGDVAAAAAAALGKLGDEKTAALLEQAMVRAAADRIPMLADASLACARNLAAGGKTAEALAIYERLSRDGLPGSIRRPATLGLIELRGEQAAPLIAACLASDDWDQVSLGLQGSRLVPGPAVTRAMLAALDKAPPAKQRLIVDALGSRQESPEAILPVMTAMARQGDPAVRAAAIHVIGRLGGGTEIGLLFDLAGDAQPGVAEAARAVLTGLPGPEAEAAIVARFKAEDPALRLLALELAGKRAIGNANAELIRLAGDPDRKVRQTALRALGDGGGPDELNSLLDLMLKGAADGPNEYEAPVRAICARLADPEDSTQRLLARLAGATPAQRAALLRLAGAQGTPAALQAVVDALDDADATVSEAAFRALCDWPNPAAADKLLNLARTAGAQPRRILALRGYIRLIGDKRVAPAGKVAMCRAAAPLAQNDEQKKLLLAAMQQVNAPPILELAGQYLDNPAIRDEAGLAVLAIAERLAGGAGATQPAVRGVMIQAMQKVAASGVDPQIQARARALLERLGQPGTP